MLADRRRRSPLFALPVLLVALGAMGATARASGAAIADLRLHDDLVAELADRATSDDFAASDHPEVAHRLAHLVSEPDARDFIRAALERMPEHEPLIRDALDRYDLPEQLLAVPLIESGYRNLGEYTPGDSAAPGVPGKGLWMFIPDTARQYGLQVDDQVDERLDLALETDAAMRLLSDLRADFGDWGLALAAYNQGPHKVRRAIREQGTRDVWALTEAGALNHYAASVYAAALILEAPELVE